MSRKFGDHQVADDVFAFTGTDVNWVVIREGTELTLVATQRTRPSTTPPRGSRCAPPT